MKDIKGASLPGEVVFLPLHTLLDRVSDVKELKTAANLPS